MTDGAPEVLVRAAGAVGRAGGTLLGTPLEGWRDAMRAELGIPGGLVVGTGHQPEWWHPGIVAKFLWAQEAASRAGATTVWLAVDTDIRDPAELRLPVMTPGGPAGAVHRFGPRAPAGTPACARAACAPHPHDDAAEPPALPCVADGLARAAGALRAHIDEPDAAAQSIAAVVDCTPGLTAPATIVRSSALLGTALGAALLDRAAADPMACALAFNAAVTEVRRVASPLDINTDGGPELPFWTPAADGTRCRVRAADLEPLRKAGAPLWPRAFLTSLIARAALCDRFVHGTGGGTYERATESFARRWLGAELPPFDVASATMRLPFPPDHGPPPVTAAERRARWFDPDGAGSVPSERKRALLAAIDAAPRGSAGRRAAWRAMHDDLARARNARACDFMELEARAAADRARARAAALRADRTWACVLHPPEAVSRLAESVRRHPR